MCMNISESSEERGPRRDRLALRVTAPNADICTGHQKHPEANSNCDVQHVQQRAHLANSEKMGRRSFPPIRPGRNPRQAVFPLLFRCCSYAGFGF